jgi:hypothetical protein
MDKTSRLNLIKKLAAKRSIENNKLEVLSTFDGELYVPRVVETTYNDVIDELNRLESFTYTSNFTVLQNDE